MSWGLCIQALQCSCTKLCLWECHNSARSWVVWERGIGNGFLFSLSAKILQITECKNCQIPNKKTDGDSLHKVKWNCPFRSFTLDLETFNDTRILLTYLPEISLAALRSSSASQSPSVLVGLGYILPSSLLN